MTALTVYLITRLSCIRMFLIIAVIAFFIFLVLVYAIGSADGRDVKKSLMILTVLTVISAAGAVFIPSTADMVSIYLVPKITNNEKIPGIGGDLLGIVEREVKKRLQEGD